MHLNFFFVWLVGILGNFMGIRDLCAGVFLGRKLW